MQVELLREGRTEQILSGASGWPAECFTLVAAEHKPCLQPRQIIDTGVDPEEYRSENGDEEGQKVAGGQYKKQDSPSNAFWPG